MTNKKEQIINCLKSQGLASTTAISESTHSNIYITKERLNKLEEEGLIEKITTNKFTYWKLTK